MKSKPSNGALLAQLFRAEDALRRRCTVVASRLEIANSALVLLEVACHADAALDDLDRLAAARDVPLDTVGSKVLGLASNLSGWLSDLWPSAASLTYLELLLEMRRDLALAVSLRGGSLGAGDRRMAEWCALWLEQRTGQADRLAVALVGDAAAAAATGAADTLDDHMARA